MLISTVNRIASTVDRQHDTGRGTEEIATALGTATIREHGRSAFPGYERAQHRRS